MKKELEPEEVPMCPHCDQPIQFADYAVASAHGCFYLCCAFCAEEMRNDYGPES